jgi:hypothetical protein
MKHELGQPISADDATTRKYEVCKYKQQAPISW